MESVISKEFIILPSRCDGFGKLGIPQIFAAFGDIATLHADDIGVGLSALMPKRLFWVTVKTVIRINRLPAMSESHRITTWPETPERVRTYRDYRISTNDGESLIEGRSEWSIIDLDTGRPQSVADVFPADFVFSDEKTAVPAFTRVRDDMGDIEPFAEYTVRSTDTDVGGHFNNANYVRALAGVFSSAEWDGMNIREMEIIYKAQSYEGDRLFFRRRTEENGDLRICVSNAENKTVLQVIIR